MALRPLLSPSVLLTFLLLGDALEIEEDKKNPLAEALEIVKQEVSECSNYHTLIVMMIGDPLLLFEEIAKLYEPLKEPVEILRLIVRLLQQNQHTFKEILNSPEKLKELEGGIAKYLVSPIINYLTGELQVL